MAGNGADVVGAADGGGDDDAEEIAEMTPDGESESWCRQKANQLRIMEEEFLPSLSAAQKKRFGVGDTPSWDALPEDVVCREPFYSVAATYITEKYIIPEGSRNAGEKLSIKPALALLGGWLQRAKNKYEKTTGSGATKVHATAGRLARVSRRAPSPSASPHQQVPPPRLRSNSSPAWTSSRTRTRPGGCAASSTRWCATSSPV